MKVSKLIWVGCLFGVIFHASINLAEDLVVQPVQGNAIRMVPLVRAADVNQDRGDWFDSWVFGGMSSVSARKRLDSTGAQRIELLKQKCELTDEQVAKLELAKRGDIARFFQQIDAVRLTVGSQRPNRENMAELSKAISPVQRIWNTELIGSDSLFLSMLQSVLSENQKELLRQDAKLRMEEKNRFHAMSMIKMIEHSMPLTDKQRLMLLELIIDQTMEGRVESNFQQYVSIQAATKLSDETLASFLDASQLTTFRQLQKHWETNIPFLNQMIKKPPSPTGEEWLDVLLR